MSRGDKRAFVFDEAPHQVLPSPEPAIRRAKQPKQAPPVKQFQLRSLSNRDRGYQRTNDEIHTTIALCPVTRAIIDTRPFQRLRGIHQLARADLVFMNVNHNRFEHSLGVSHLAEKLCKSIQVRQPGLGISEKDVLCVKLAGLLHDVGHGIFSHVYEIFVQKCLPEYLEDHPELQVLYSDYPERPKGWSHEMVSLDMVDLILEELGLQIDTSSLDSPLKQIGDGIDRHSIRVFLTKDLQSQDHESTSIQHTDGGDVLTSRDFIFVKECIFGKPLPGCSSFIGRPSKYKEFLYDIVSNRHSGLDVDKIDYFARDERRALWASGQIEAKMIDEAVVAWADCTDESGSCNTCQKPGREHDKQHLMICYPEKLVSSCFRFFKKRYRNHDVIYKHKVARSGQMLIYDILCRADPFFRLSVPISHPSSSLPRQRFQSLPISRAMMEPRIFLEMNDSILDVIYHSQDERLYAAKKLIYERYKPRHLYKCVGQQVIRRKTEIGRHIWSKAESQIATEMLLLSGEHRDPDGSPVTLEMEDFIVDKCSSNHGAGDRNPLEKMRFVRRDDLAKMHNSVDHLPIAEKINDEQYDTELPRSFEQTILRIYTRTDTKAGLVSHVFAKWYDLAQSGENVVTCNDVAMTTCCEEEEDDDDDKKMPPVQLSQDDSVIDDIEGTEADTASD